MSAASSASRPPMKMPVRATPFGPREKMVSCVSAGDAVDADLAVRHDDLVAGVGRHVDVERAHLPARREHVEDVGTFHGDLCDDSEDCEKKLMRQRAGGVGRRSITRAVLRADTMRSVRAGVDDAGRARGVDQRLGRACEGTMAKPVGPQELWPIAAARLRRPADGIGAAIQLHQRGRPRGAGRRRCRPAPARSARRAAAARG